MWLLGGPGIEKLSDSLVADGAVLILLGLGVAFLISALAIRSEDLRRTFAEPILAASQDKLRAGEEFEVTYQQRLRREAVVRSLAVRLVRRETADNGEGYSTHDETVQEFEWRTLQGPILSGHATFRIPDHAMHSFRGEYNRLEWLIVVQVDLTRWQGFKEEYVITVQHRLGGGRRP